LNALSVRVAPVNPVQSIVACDGAWLFNSLHRTVA